MADEQQRRPTRLTSAIMFVKDLERAVSFYTDTLALDTADRDPTAALLASADGSHLILRAMGHAAEHPLGGTGVQYVVWAAGSADDLARFERVLKERSAYVSTREFNGITVIEGRDPDGVAVVMCHPGPDEIPAHEARLWPRIYAW